jgi:hypothetical protein
MNFIFCQIAKLKKRERKKRQQQQLKEKNFLNHILKNKNFFFIFCFFNILISL